MKVLLVFLALVACASALLLVPGRVAVGVGGLGLGGVNVNVGGLGLGRVYVHRHPLRLRRISLVDPIISSGWIGSPVVLGGGLTSVKVLGLGGGLGLGGIDILKK